MKRKGKKRRKRKGEREEKKKKIDNEADLQTMSLYESKTFALVFSREN